MPNHNPGENGKEQEKRISEPTGQSRIFALGGSMFNAKSTRSAGESYSPQFGTWLCPLQLVPTTKKPCKFVNMTRMMRIKRMMRMMRMRMRMRMMRMMRMMMMMMMILTHYYLYIYYHYILLYTIMLYIYTHIDILITSIIKMMIMIIVLEGFNLNPQNPQDVHGLAEHPLCLSQSRRSRFPTPKT